MSAKAKPVLSAKAKPVSSAKAKPVSSAKAKPGTATVARSRKGARKRPTLADRANRHSLYQQSVQCPDYDVRVFAKTYRAIRGKSAWVMREDFCGTGLLSLNWVQGHPKRRAIGVDFDEPTLDYGREHVLAKASPAARRRVQLIHGNVLDPIKTRADVTCAMNFSFCVFKTRTELKQYCRRAYEGLARDGIFIAELYGGTDTMRPLVERRKVGRVTYVWQQEKFDPITNETLCHIHFTFPDGSRIRKAFTYDWRLWSIPELRECMLESGFSRVDVYWEGADEDGEPNGRYSVVTTAENQLAWLVYVVGVK